MTKRRTIASRPAWALLLVLAAPALAQAAPAPTPAVTDGETLAAERVRLRGELDRASAEIDALKKARPGVGDDYRLRARLADAEALARRLIEIEARLGLRAPVGKPAPLPIAAASDGPAELDAKADILADRARRVRGEADALGQRVAEIKGRQELRRRAADLDRDPFAPLEGSKRRFASTAAPSSASGDKTAPSPGGSMLFVPGPSGMPQQQPVGSSGQPGTPITVTATPAPPPLASPTPLSRGADTGAATFSVELRDLLDPATVAELGHLEAAKSPTRAVQALERAVAALRARADALDNQAHVMRASAAQK
jgi:hypothetical protein